MLPSASDAGTDDGQTNLTKENTVIKSILMKLLYPSWYLETKQVLDAWEIENRRVLAEMDETLASLKAGSSRLPQQGLDPFIPEGRS